MALSGSTIIEVRSTGNDNNGGGFVTGASGTDYSQQNSPQYALTGIASVGAGNIILSASAAADMVGNIAQVISGTNFTTGFFQIVSVVVGVSITFSTNNDGTAICTGVGASGVINIGGALATPTKGIAIQAVTGIQMYIKASATYIIATGISTPSGINPVLGICRVIGYTTTRGDKGRATIQASAAITMITEGQGGFRFENLVLDGNVTANKGISITGVSTSVFNCVIKGCLDNGVNLGASGDSLLESEVTTCGGATVLCSVIVNAAGCSIRNNYIHANTTAGIEIVSNAVNISGNIISSNTGASSDGIRINATYSLDRCPVFNNVLYANGRDGFRTTGTYEIGEIANNLFVSNVGIGLNTSVMNPVIADVLIHNNAYFGNGTDRSGNIAGSGDVTLTGNPFVSAGTGNFALNNTAGAGAAARAAGYPGIMIGGGTGFSDIGPLQSQASSSTTASANSINNGIWNSCISG